MQMKAAQEAKKQMQQYSMMEHWYTRCIESNSKAMELRSKSEKTVNDCAPTAPRKAQTNLQNKYLSADHFSSGSYFLPGCNFLHLDWLKLGSNCSGLQNCKLQPQIWSWIHLVFKTGVNLRYYFSLYGIGFIPAAGHILVVRRVVIEFNTLWGLLKRSISQEVEF